MCKGSDIIKAAAVAAAAYYTGGASLAAEGGAAAGTMAAANAAGAAGGDALGTLIAGNAANWGVSVAPELMAAGAGLAAGSGVGGGATEGATGTAAGTKGGVSLSTLASGASVANAGMGLLTAMKGTKTPPPPSLLAPIVMPTADDLATQRARSAMIAKLSQRRGRTSTILSNDTLGGN
jgi:hypothetical protein